MRREKGHYMLSIATWAVIIALWFAATNLGLVRSTLIPSPQRVMRAFVNIMRDGYNATPFYIHLKMSMGRLLIAVVLAIFTAIPLGLLSGYLKKISAVIDSLVNFYRPLPPMAYYVLLIMWLGIDEESKVNKLLQRFGVFLGKRGGALADFVKQVVSVEFCVISVCSKQIQISPFFKSKHYIIYALFHARFGSIRRKCERYCMTLW